MERQTLRSFGSSSRQYTGRSFHNEFSYSITSKSLITFSLNAYTSAFQ